MLAVLMAVAVQMAHVQAAELVMFESEICEWCDAWHEEIGPVYPKTEEGKRAPLRQVDIHDARPSDLVDVEGIRFTPTFVLLDDSGDEVGRINGYPGEDFFWGMLSELIAALPAAPKTVIETRAERRHPPTISMRSYSALTEYNS